MLRKLSSSLVALVFVFSSILGVAALGFAQAGPPQGFAGPAQGVAGPGQGFAGPGQAGGAPGGPISLGAATAQAQTISTDWGNLATAGANFDFGNPVSTSTANLPGQVQTAITLGKLEAFSLALQALGF